MGLGASQARLLTITGRMHDIELKSQYIMNQKIALATQQDATYQEYCDALDAKTLQVAYTSADGKLNYVDATYDAVCGYNPKRVGTYTMTDADTGKVIVNREIYDVYNSMNSNDKYEFAMQMMGLSSDELLEDETNYGDIGVSITGQPDADSAKARYCSYSGTYYDKENECYNGYVIMNDAEAAVYEQHQDDFKSYMEAIDEAVEKADKDEINEAISDFRDALYQKYSGEIYSSICSSVGAKDLEEFDSEMEQEFNYYVKLFEGIEAAGGCTTMSDFSSSGDDGVNWFTKMVQSGKVLLNEYNSTGVKKGTWSVINVATSTNLKEVSDDLKIKKAEAKYEHELNKIKQKDARYDRDLESLETERTALKTEMDSINKVKEDNVERTFGIFS